MIRASLFLRFLPFRNKRIKIGDFLEIRGREPILTGIHSKTDINLARALERHHRAEGVAFPLIDNEGTIHESALVLLTRLWQDKGAEQFPPILDLHFEFDHDHDPPILGHVFDRQIGALKEPLLLLRHTATLIGEALNAEHLPSIVGKGLQEQFPLEQVPLVINWRVKLNGNVLQYKESELIVLYTFYDLTLHKGHFWVLKELHREVEGLVAEGKGLRGNWRDL